MKKFFKIIICLCLSISLAGCGNKESQVTKEEKIKIIEDTFEGSEGKLSLNDALIDYIYNYIQKEKDTEDLSLSTCFYSYMIEKTAPEIARPVKKCQENLPAGLQLYYWINVDLEKEIESYFVYISNGEQLSNVKFEYKVLQGKWVFSTYDLPALDQILSYDQFYEIGRLFISAFTQGMDTKEDMHQLISDLQEHDYSFGEDYYVFINTYKNDQGEDVQYLAVTPQEIK